MTVHNVQNVENQNTALRTDNFPAASARVLATWLVLSYYRQDIFRLWWDPR